MESREKQTDLMEKLHKSQRKIEQLSDIVAHQEEAFRLLFSQMDEAALIVSAVSGGRGALLDANKAACDLLGYSYPVLLTKELKELEASDTTLTLSSLMLRPNAGEKAELESTFIYSGGEQRVNKVIAQKMLYGGEEAIFILFPLSVSANRSESDVSLPVDRCEAEGEFLENAKRYQQIGEVLKEEQSLYQALYENNVTIMWMVDPATMRIVDVNNAAVEFYGYSRETLLTMSLAEINMYSSTKIADLLEGVKSNRRKSFLFCHRLASGKIRNMEVFSGTFTRKGRPIILSFLYDVTERVKTERLLMQARKKAELAYRSKSEFIANVSHEIRTPLNGIMGMLQLLQATTLEETQREFVEIAVNSSRNLLHVLNDLLDFSRMEAGKMEVVSEKFEIADLLKSILRMFEVDARNKGLKLEASVHRGLPRWVAGDSKRLRQILFNLLGNSFKFTEQGKIRVEVYSLPTPINGKIRLFFSVSDTGSGIPDEKVNYVFESFTQVDGSFSRRHQGTGLGLPIVKRLVELMGGNVVVETEVGEGTTVLFCILVDEVECEDVSHLNCKTTTAPVVSGRKILVAEDEQVNLLLIRQMLERMGHKVVAAPNGKIALDILSEEQVDFVFMDIQMPEMDGLEATKMLRKHPAYAHLRNLPVVALTAHAQEEDRKRALDCGMTDYISKPFEWGDLQRVIASSAV